MWSGFECQWFLFVTSVCLSFFVKYPHNGGNSDVFTLFQQHRYYALILNFLLCWVVMTLILCCIMVNLLANKMSITWIVVRLKCLYTYMMLLGHLQFNLCALRIFFKNICVRSGRMKSIIYFFITIIIRIILVTKGKNT